MSNVADIKSAKRRAPRTPPPAPPRTDTWRDSLVTKWTANGPKIIANDHNTILVLTNAAEWDGAVAFDLFAERTIIVKSCPAQPVGPFPSPWGDVHDVVTAAWLQSSEYALDVKVGMVATAIGAVARSRQVHPLRDHLTSLAWDGVPRIDTWLPVYFGADDTPYTREVGAKWLISAIARVMQPGCKADHVLVAEGKQGKKKSTAFRKLSLGFFTDEIPDLGNKDAAMQLHGVWIVELGELDALSKHDVTKVKAFVSRTVDRYRAPWGRHVGDHPRQCIFAGTTNQTDYLKDETGGRRFWPFAAGSIDVDALERDAGQLWAEARARFDAGATWWLEGVDAVARAEEAQGERYVGDSWDAKISMFVSGDEWTTVGKVLFECFDIKEKDHDQPLQNRVARCLKSHGWTRRRERVGKIREYRYYPPSPVAESGDNGGTRPNPAEQGTVPTVPTVPSKSEEGGGEILEKIGSGGGPGDTGDTGDSDTWEEGRE